MPFVSRTRIRASQETRKTVPTTRRSPFDFSQSNLHSTHFECFLSSTSKTGLRDNFRNAFHYFLSVSHPNYINYKLIINYFITSKAVNDHLPLVFSCSCAHASNVKCNFDHVSIGQINTNYTRIFSDSVREYFYNSTQIKMQLPSLRI